MMMSEVITTRVSQRACSRGCAIHCKGQRVLSFSLSPHGPLNTEDKARHQKSYCLLPLMSFPFVAFTCFERLITTTAAVVVCLSYKTAKIILNGHIFITCYEKMTVVFEHVNGNSRTKAKSFPKSLKHSPHTSAI